MSDSHEPSTPTKRVCPTCGGTGYLYDDAAYTRAPCNCRVAEYMVRHLGNEIAWAKTIISSPLFEFPEHDGKPPKLDRTTENLHITSTWAHLLPHLKLCLWVRGVSYHFHVATDRDLIEIRHAEKFHERDYRERDPEQQTRLSEVVDPPQLLIIRLGFMAEKLSDSADIILGVLLGRESKNKPTWVVTDTIGPDIYGRPGKQLVEYITRNLKPVVLHA